MVTPYGYGGPTGDGFWDAYEDWARERGVVSTFVRFHPLLANQRGRADPRRGARADGGVARSSPSATCSPACTSSTATRCARPRTPARPSRSTRAWASSSPLYEDTMRRTGRRPASTSSSRPYWERLGELPLARFDAAIDGEVVASALCLATPPWLHYHLSGTTDAGPLDRRLDARPARGRALGPGERLRALPPRRRPGRQGRLAAPLQGPLRPGRPRPGRGRQGDPRRGRLPRAERRRGAATRASSPLIASRVRVASRRGLEGDLLGERGRPGVDARRLSRRRRGAAARARAARAQGGDRADRHA